MERKRLAPIPGLKVVQCCRCGVDLYANGPDVGSGLKEHHGESWCYPCSDAQFKAWKSRDAARRGGK